MSLVLGNPREQTRTVTPNELRARFAIILSDLYGREVPAYRTLLEVAHSVNTDVAAELGPTRSGWAAWIG